MRELRLESFALQEGSQQSRQFYIVVDDEYPHGSNVSRRPTSACHALLLFTYVYMKYKQGLRTPRKMEVEGTRSHETLHESIDRRRAGGTRSKSRGRAIWRLDRRAIPSRSCRDHRPLRPCAGFDGRAETDGHLLFNDAKAQAEPIVVQLKQGHESMAAAIKANKSDAEINDIAGKQGALIGQLAAIHSKAMAKFYAQLTPEQKNKADAIHDHIKARFMGRLQAAR